ncbi:hypothetical protein GCM10010282_53520 [Streptomyces roseolus]|nr:hypothetical protein GCM10010282_53520 [Streptomyces roseolus]
MQPAIKPFRLRHHAWSTTFHAYGLSSKSAHAAFGGYKQSGIGRETHKMMLEHYQQTKNMLVSYSPKKLGFFQGHAGREERCLSRVLPIERLSTASSGPPAVATPRWSRPRPRPRRGAPPPPGHAPGAYGGGAHARSSVLPRSAAGPAADPSLTG